MLYKVMFLKFATAKITINKELFTIFAAKKLNNLQTFRNKRKTTMNIDKIKGYSLAAFAAAAYGTNPAFAIPLYNQGMNPVSVLLFRYIIGLPLLLLLMRIRGIDPRLHKNEIIPVAILGVLMALSSLTLFESYEYMNSGVASTLLFVYPIMVAVLMMFFFHERLRSSVALCLVIMSVGLWFLIKTDGDASINSYGLTLVMLSALTYAIYIMMVNVSKIIKNIPTTRLLFYLLTFGSLLFVAILLSNNNITLPAENSGWLNLFALAIVPTLISLACTTRAIQLIGSTPTAILGALEPVSAVILSVIVLNQSLTEREVIGGLLIIIATTIVVNEPVDKAILHVRKMFPRRHRH